MTRKDALRTGGCLCGGVRYEVSGEMRPVVYCHCSQCRKTSGHFVAASACSIDDLKMIAEASLRWFKSSSHAERGFCENCGGNLFWRPLDGRHISIMAGTIDSPTGVKAIAHIYTGDASDYHVFADDLPQYADRGPADLET
ncbi:MAG: GFA family protein [Woeseiaceae bacterium]|nr:GFA family protein [Woeseiaceae bacterium]